MDLMSADHTEVAHLGQAWHCSVQVAPLDPSTFNISTCGSAIGRHPLCGKVRPILGLRLQPLSYNPVNLSLANIDLSHYSAETGCTTLWHIYLQAYNHIWSIHKRIMPIHTQLH